MRFVHGYDVEEEETPEEKLQYKVRRLEGRLGLALAKLYALLYSRSGYSETEARILLEQYKITKPKSSKVARKKFQVDLRGI